MIKKTAAYIKEKLLLKKPEIAIILGSGLGQFAENLENACVLPYKDIPDFPQSTVKGHKGEMIRGFIGNHEVLCLNGRFHLYEGHNPQVIAQVIYILKELGVKKLVVTNAAGSLKKELVPGSLMLINDHINFSGKSPLVGQNNEKYGPRFPAISNAYPEYLRQKLKQIAQKENIELKEGVYLMVLGPNFETQAEVKAFAAWGADAVGMSTVPEVIVAAQCGIDILGISIITNYAAGISSHLETLAEANKASSKMIKLVSRFIEEE